MGITPTVERRALLAAAFVLLATAGGLAAFRAGPAPLPFSAAPAPPPAPPEVLPAMAAVAPPLAAPLAETAPAPVPPPLVRIAVGRTASLLGAEAVCVQQAEGSRVAARIVLDRDAIELVLLGQADLALVSVPLSPHDPQRGLRSEPLAVELFALAVADAAPVRELSAGQARLLLTGQVRDWQQFGLPAQPIAVVAPADEGARARAARVLTPGDPLAADRLGADERSVLERVKAEPGAIGVVRLGAARGTAGVRLLPIGGVPPSVEAFRAGTYPFGTPVLAVSAGPPSGAAAQRLALARAGAPPFGNAALSSVR